MNRWEMYICTTTDNFFISYWYVIISEMEEKWVSYFYFLFVCLFLMNDRRNRYEMVFKAFIFRSICYFRLVRQSAMYGVSFLMIEVIGRWWIAASFLVSFNEKTHLVYYAFFSLPGSVHDTPTLCLLDSYSVDQRYHLIEKR